MPGIVTLPPKPNPKPKPSEVSQDTAQVRLSPQRSLRNTPRPTPQRSRSSPIRGAASLENGQPGRQSNSKFASTVNRISGLNSISTQSDGEGSVTKKRRVALETSDGGTKSSDEIRITKLLAKKDIPSLVDRFQVLRHNNTNISSPAYTVGRRIHKSACQTLKEANSIAVDDQGEGENLLHLATESSKSVNQISQILNEPLVGDTKTTVTTSSQHLQNETSLGTDKAAQPLLWMNNAEGIVVPPGDVPKQARPTRKKRKIIGDDQTFSNETIAVQEPGSSAATVGVVDDEGSQNTATRKIPKPRGPRKKASYIIGEENTADRNVQNPQPRKIKSRVQGPQIQDGIEQQPRKRGRPKKVVSAVREESSLGDFAESVKLTENDLGAQSSEAGSSLGKSQVVTEERPNASSLVPQDIVDQTLQGVSHKPGIGACEYGTEVIDAVGTLSLEPQGRERNSSTFLGQTSYSPGLFYNAVLGKSGVGVKKVHPPENSTSETHEQSQDISSHQGDISRPPTTSYGARLSESDRGVDLHQLEPTSEILSPPNERQLKKFVLPVGKENNQRELSKLDKSGPVKKLPLSQSQTKILPSRKLGRPKKVIDPALEGNDKEKGSRRVKRLNNNKSSTQALQLMEPSTTKIDDAKVAPQTHSQAVKKSRRNEIEPFSQTESDSQIQPPITKKRGRKKQTIPPAGLPLQTEEVRTGSKEGRSSVSRKPPRNLQPIRVWRLSGDRGEKSKAAENSTMCLGKGCITAADFLTPVYHYFTTKAYRLKDCAMQGDLSKPSKGQLKRKLEISEECGENFDMRLLQLVCLVQ